MKKQKIKIVFVLPSLVPGGAERVISFVSQNINKAIFSPTLLIAGYSKDTVYNVSNIKVKYLNKSRVLFAMPFIVLYLLKNKTDIVISSISHTNMAMSIISPLFSNTKFIGREATVLSKRKNEKKTRKWSLACLMPNRFKNLDILICQSIDMAEDMSLNYHVPKNKIRVINNPISNLPPIKLNKSKGDIKKFITVGRLTEVKGHLRILDALSKLNTKFIYTMIGDGHYKDLIFEKAKILGLTDSIKHIPYTSDVNKYLADYDMFLQGSYVEGFPNALLESCVVGTPVLAFDVPGGTKEIVENGVNGFLVNNEKEFIEILKDNNEWNPQIIRDSVYKKFNQEKILQQYEDLFIDIVKN